MEWTSVKSQAEFDAAIVARKSHIEIAASLIIEVRIEIGFTPIIKSLASSLLRLFAGRATLRGNARAELWENASAELWENATATLRGNARAELWENASAELWENASATLRGNATATLWENARVAAYAAASLSLFGIGVSATASANVAVHLHEGAKCDGGVQIPVDAPRTPQEWCEWYGVAIDDTHAIVFKGVDAKFMSPKGADYTPATETIAHDWDGGKEECGGGLHFSPSAAMTLEFNPSAKRFVACRISMDFAVHPGGSYPHKIKAAKCWNLYECDRHGEMIGERFERPVRE